MAHFAQLDDNNIVTQVIVINNSIITDENNVEHEQLGIDFCKSLYGNDTNWKQTSYNASIRHNYAGVGFTYNATLDAYIPPCIYSSWILDETLYRYIAPSPYPTDGKFYYWDEISLSWIEYPPME